MQRVARRTQAGRVREGNAAPLAAIFLAATASFWDGHHHGKTAI